MNNECPKCKKEVPLPVLLFNKVLCNACHAEWSEWMSSLSHDEQMKMIEENKKNEMSSLSHNEMKMIEENKKNVKWY